jgi:hypothetical protein
MIAQPFDRAFETSVDGNARAVMLGASGLGFQLRQYWFFEHFLSKSVRRVEAARRVRAG